MIQTFEMVTAKGSCLGGGRAVGCSGHEYMDACMQGPSEALPFPLTPTPSPACPLTRLYPSPLPPPPYLQAVKCMPPGVEQWIWLCDL